IALPPFEVKSFSIDAAEPLSSAVSMTTLAPAARHACACAFCFCGSFNAFVIMAVTPAALNALAKSGASNCTQRTDDFVSGNRTQTWALAFFVPTLAPAPDVTSAATAARARSRKIDLLEIFFTADLLLLRGLTSTSSAQGSGPPGGSQRTTLPHWRLYVKGGSAIRVRLAAREDITRHLGVREHGHTVQRRRLQAGADRCIDCYEGTHRGRGSRRPDRRLRVPLSAGARPREPRRGAGGARRPRDLLRLQRPPSRCTVWEGRLLLPGRLDQGRGAPPDTGGHRPRRRGR